MLLKESGGFEARDPWIIYYNGMYYHCFSNTEAIFISHAKSLEELSVVQGVCVFKPERNKEYSKELWAPELHIIDKKCYIYVACDDGRNENHRMYVLANHSSNPLIPYEMGGKISDNTNKWAIDGTILQFKNQLYMIWSGWEGDVNICQNLYIARMSNPYTIDSERVLISTPEYLWEKQDCNGVDLPYINEGPCAYINNGKLYIFYSASGSWANHYCLGMLEFVGNDLLKSESWKKHDSPLLSLMDGWNGPGHCSIFLSKGMDYIAFHVYDDGKTSGWVNVHAVIHPFKLENGKLILLQ